jgi:1,4-alpha-glucan branching enzyme
MKKTPDGERYWFQLTGLTKGVEYGFQYLVDGEIRVADPFADKILDPDDQYIPSNSYANPKPFPDKANFGEWYEKRVSVFQTGQEVYQWEVINFESPKKEELVIYELLLRDFFSADERHYNNLIDTLTYLKRLGVNAIELMPVTEFNGNDSWGYNPTFMFAVDKAYGSKNMLKHFIDEAHKVGIAVILDMVLNQQDRPNPYLEMYWEGNAPAQNNPWFNRTAKHPFNVFSDMNHESAYTKAYVDTVSHYWLTEYKFDGLRFDLSKGFTQQDNFNNEQAWTSYDASRIAILKRIASKIWSYKPQAYVMLEHLGSDQEEKELADAGMMLWGNMNGAYKDAASGKNADLSRAYYKNRNWTQSNLITYMESHDEERLMHAALTSGLSNGSYNIRVKETALDRMKLNTAFFFLVHGPKLMWQFGEMGFDTSIRLCTDGSLKDDCRTNAKPPMWNYQNEPERAKLNKVYQMLIELRKTEAFKGGDFTWNAGEQIKQLHISHPTLDIFTFGNFSTSSVGYRPSFPAKEKWYDYLSGDSIDVLIMDAELNLEPGEFHIYTNKRLTAKNNNLVPFKSDLVLSSQDEIVKCCFIYPNPSMGVFMIMGAKSSEKIFISDMAGRSINYKIDDFRDYKTIQLEEPKAGIYLLQIKGEVNHRRIKLIVE